MKFLSRLFKKKDKREPLWKKQRKKWGFDERDLWSLDYTIAKFVLPRLERFRANPCGRPGLISYKEWDGILGEMIFAMKVVIRNGDGKWPNEREMNRYDEGMRYFAYFFMDLWT